MPHTDERACCWVLFLLSPFAVARNVGTKEKGRGATRCQQSRPIPGTDASGSFDFATTVARCTSTASLEYRARLFSKIARRKETSPVLHKDRLPEILQHEVPYHVSRWTQYFCTFPLITPPRQDEDHRRLHVVVELLFRFPLKFRR